MPKEQVARNKSAPNRAGKRRAWYLKYYEMTYPERKLRRMFHSGYSIARLRQWADNYKTPSGASGISALIKLGKQFQLNLG